MANPSRIAWAAGVFEGEGSFHAGRGVGMKVAMTDEDVVRRFADVMGWRVYGPYLQKESRPGWSKARKPIFHARVDNFEQVQAAIAMFWPWLGVRRRSRAAELLLSIPRTSRGRRRHG